LRGAWPPSRKKKGTQASDADQIERGYENYDLNRFYLWLE
jgi:hypothetical protein